MNLNFEKLITGVPVIKINHISENEVYATLEKFNIGGSVKVKTMYWILKKAIERGEIESSKVLLEASSGNAAICLSYLANSFGLKAELVVPKNTATCKKKLIMAYGAKLIEVEGGTDNAIDLKNKLFQENPGKYYMTEQFDNIDNYEAHYNLTGPFIAEKIGKIDFLVAGIGTAGTILGAGAYLKEQFPDMKLIAIDPVQRVEGIYNYSNPDKGPIYKREKGKIYEKYKHLIDEMIEVDFEEDVVSGVNDYIEEGYFVGISSGAILSGAKKYLSEKKGLKGVVIAPDGGDFYFDELFNFIDKEKVKGCK